MIKRIFFYDGELEKSILRADKHFNPDRSLMTVDGRYGFTFGVHIMELASKLDGEADIYTNMVEFLSFDWFNLEDVLDTRGKVWLYNFRHLSFDPVESFTDKELRKAHNLTKMFIAGCFDIGR